MSDRTSSVPGEIDADELDRRLTVHLANRLGEWPPSEEVTIVGSPKRTELGWDGRVQTVVGVASPTGTVLSVPPDYEDQVRTVLSTEGANPLFDRIGELVGSPRHQLFRGIFRSSRAVVDLPEAGEWIAHDDLRVPEWLRPFGGDVLIALSPDGRYMAGVGCKRHDEFGTELAVGTKEEFRNQGLARRLVAQASKAVLREGKIATYLHRGDNLASAAVAEATGFPDLGWTVLGLGPPRN